MNSMHKRLRAIPAASLAQVRGGNDTLAVENDPTILATQLGRPKYEAIRVDPPTDP